MEQEREKYIIKVLQKVFQDGYRPARGDEPYSVRLKNGVPASGMVNCMGHIFNLQNQQFDDYEIKPYEVVSHNYAFPYFMGLKADSNDKSARMMLNLIKKTGLKVTECAPDEIISDFKSWKIALYFSAKDFHYLLEDFPRQWSGKIGDTGIVEHFNNLTPPKEYCNHRNTLPAIYRLYGTYKLTNKKADENNKYVKDFVAKKKKCIITLNQDINQGKEL